MAEKAIAELDFAALSPLAPELASTMARISSDIALVIDRDGVIRNVAEGPRVLSPSCSSWVGQRWVDTATADTRRKIELLLDEVRSSGITRRREVNHPAPGGDDFPVAWAAIRLGESGTVVAGGRDLRAAAAIQQRFLEAQQEMERDYWRRRSEENRYRLLFQAASDAVLVLDASSFELLEANESALALLGQRADAIVGRPWPDSLPASSRGAVRELLGAVRSAGRSAEARVRLVAGEAADLSITPFRVGDEQHLVVRARRGELAPEATHNLLRMADFVESTPDGVVITDSAGHILMANPAFVGLVQQGDESNLRGRLLQDVMGDRDDRVRGMLARTRAQGVAPRSTLELRVIAGPTLAVEVTAALMTDGDRECVGFTMRPNELSRGTTATEGPIEDVMQALSELSTQVGRVPLQDLLAEAGHLTERHLIETAVTRAGGVVTVAAELLGLTPESLVLRLRRHGLAARIFGGNQDDSNTIN